MCIRDRVFTAPHCRRTQGVVKSTKPYVYNGQIIRDFSVTFREGRAVEWSAGENEELLTRMLTENSRFDQYSEHFERCYLEELLLMLMRHSVMNEKEPDLLNSRDADILLATRYIYNNFRKPLTLEEVSSVASLSPTYFSKKFKLITGMGFKEYLNYVRLKHAQTALLTTNSSITDIALEYGFNDLSLIHI